MNHQPPRQSRLAVGLTFCYCPKELLQYLSLLNSEMPKPLFGSLSITTVAVQASRLPSTAAGSSASIIPYTLAPLQSKMYGCTCDIRSSRGNPCVGNVPPIEAYSERGSDRAVRRARHASAPSPACLPVHRPSKPIRLSVRLRGRRQLWSIIQY